MAPTVLPVDSINLNHYSLADLLKLRDYVNARLPSAEVEDLDLNEELVRTFQIAKDLLEQAKDDDETPLTQKAAALNSINSLLKSLADTQKTLFSAERQQKLENALAAALKKFPDLQEEFFNAYEAKYEGG